MSVDHDAIRAAFEAWAKEYQPGIYLDGDATEDSAWEYFNLEADTAFHAYHAGYAAARNAKDTGGEG